MALRSQQTRFVLSLIIIGVALAAVGVGVYLSRQSMVRAEKRLQHQQREWAALRRVSPAPTTAVAEAIVGDVTQVESSLAALHVMLRGGEKADRLRRAPVPEKRTDAFFDLAAYVDRMRSLAQKHQVAVKPDERFGFAVYANGGPANDQIATVFRQRQVLQYLLGELFAASPERLDRVERSAPAGGNPREAAEEDLFALDPAWSMQVPGFIDTLAFRISFTGETAVLRHWLDRLAKFDLPVVVRMVEAAPLKRRPRTPSTPATHSLVLTGNSEPIQPLVARVPVKFTVTLEYLLLLQPLPEVKP